MTDWVFELPVNQALAKCDSEDPSVRGKAIAKALREGPQAMTPGTAWSPAYIELCRKRLEYAKQDKTLRALLEDFAQDFEMVETSEELEEFGQSLFDWADSEKVWMGLP